MENIISHLNFPFKFVLNVEGMDLRKVLDPLETRRSIKEIELGRLPERSKEERRSRLMREIEQIESDIRAIKSSNVPVRVLHYLMTSSSGQSRVLASERAKSQIRSVSAEFDAILNSRSTPICGDELARLIKIDSAIT